MTKTYSEDKESRQNVNQNISVAKINDLAFLFTLEIRVFGHARVFTHGASAVEHREMQNQR